MADVIPSTNMNLPVPVVTVDPGPQWASDINSCLTLIDAHTHAAGSGAPVTPDGLNINSDLPMNNSNLTLTRSVNFTAQVAPLALPADVGCVYVSGQDLYYNDTLGNQVRLTQSGNVAGTSGSIANLVSPASASYVGATPAFVFQSAANTPANIDGASFTLRNLSANSKGLTLAPPNAMGSNYSITLPSLPASTKILSMDASGNIGAAYDVDNSSLEISSNVLQIKNQGVSQAKLAMRTTGTTVGAGGVAVSTAAAVNIVSTSFVDVTNLVVTITTLGRPVRIELVASDISSTVGVTGSGSYVLLEWVIQRDGVSIAYSFIEVNDATQINLPPSSIAHLDLVAAGTYVYKVRARVDSGMLAPFQNVKLIAYEI